MEKKSIVEKSRKARMAFIDPNPTSRADWAYSGEVFIENYSDCKSSYLVESVYRRDDDAVLAKVTDSNGNRSEMHLDILLGRYNIANPRQRKNFLAQREQPEKNLTSKLEGASQ